MSEILKLNITSLRNIVALSIQLSPHVNLLYGENGSGKTSFLESVHLLASGHSFRSSKIDPLINSESDELVIYAELSNNQQIGLSKSRKRSHQLRLQNEKQRNWENVARQLPVQIMDSNSFLLLEGGPSVRRRFLDWGVFHVEPSFVANWRKTRKCVANRNLLLKSRRLDESQLAVWDHELVEAANSVDTARKSYFERFLPIFSQVYESLGGGFPGELELNYERGWDRSRDLDQILADNLSTDMKYGATQNGPHRADITVEASGIKAIEILSRGQQKMLVSAMKLAQGKLLSESLDKQCIYLVDDLPAELDQDNRMRVFDQLLTLGGQIFVTCVGLDSMESCLSKSPEMAKFHVEHGIIAATK